MSKATAFFVLLVAVLSGLIASGTVVQYIHQQKNNQTESTIPMRTVIIAAQDISAGTTLHSDHIKEVQWPQETAPQESFDSSKAVLNRMLKTSIYQGEPFTQKRLVKPGTPGGLPALIPPGKRAITLRVDDTISVAGFVQPGHHVDIVTTLDSGAMQEEAVSKVILQNIRVLATGSEIERKDDDKAKVVQTVTVLVDLPQAERLVLASNIGTIRLVLRNHEDHSEELTSGAKLTNLIAKDQPTKVPAPQPTAIIDEPEAKPTPKNLHTVVVYRGREQSEVVFEK